MRRLLPIFLAFMLYWLSAEAQTYNMSTTTVNTCSGTFYDAGGTSTYANSESFTMTFCSSTAGQQIRFNFTSFDSEAIDKLLIYDGTSTAAPLLATVAGHSVTVPFTVTSSNGCLTFVWTSDGSIVYNGWIATISCVAIPSYPMTTGTVSACNGIFYDSGGSGSNYGNNESFTYTICSSTAGQVLKMIFSSFDTQSGQDILTIYDGPNTSGVLIGTYSGTTSPGIIYSGTSGCLTFVFSSNNSNNSAGWSATFECVSPPGSNLCVGADPFCTGSTYNFPAGVNAGSGETGPNYGCLSSTPNPVWYYLKIATTGPIEVYMYGSASEDIDFACWGPFTSPTAPCTALLTSASTTTHNVAGASTDYPSLNMVDCSFDAQEMEWCYIPNAVVGQYYLLMITNYSNAAQNIVFSQTGGTGATDCSIVAPPITNNGPLCVGQTLNLTVSNPVGGATYSWTGPNSFSSSAMNPTVTNVTTANAGVYSLVITVGTDVSAPVTTTVVVNPNPVVTPTASPATICNGASTSLSATSTVTGTTYTWNPGGLTGSPVTVSPTSNTTYTVTGTAAGCTGSATVSVTVNPMVTPAFTALGPYCTGATPGTLPATSTNGITGTWSPATISTASAGTTVYTFTPTAGQCANTATMSVVVNASNTPAFTALGPYCVGATPGALSTTSTNGITGTWSPSAVSTASAGTTTYTFTPTAGQCASPATMNVLVNAVDNPAFNYSPSNMCQTGSDVPANITGGATGTFSSSPSGLVFANTSTGLVDVSASNIGSYTITFTTNGTCPATASASVSIATTTTAFFSYAGPYCQNGTNPTATIAGGSSAGVFSSTAGLVFTNTSTGEINLATSTAGTYTVSNYLAASGGCAAVTETASVTINALPSVTVPSNITVCNAGTVAGTNFTSSPTGATYAWTNNNASIGIPLSGSGNITSFTATNTGASPVTATITVTPTLNGCTGPASTYTITVNPSPVVTVPSNIAVCHNGSIPAMNFSSNVTGTTYTWTNSNTGIGLGASGSGNISGYTASNTGATPVTGTITVTPTANGCTGNTATYTITINPLPTITFPALSALCPGSSSLTLNNATPSGGTYSGTGVSSNVFNPATSSVGTFTLTYTYTDANTCTNTATQSITVNASPTANFTLAPATGCVNIPVTATYAGNGGSGTTYTWSFNGGTATPGTGAGPHQVSWASAGVYTVSLTATENGCASAPYTQSVTIGLVSATAQLQQNVSCNGYANGQATVNVTGGATPYDYSWLMSPVQTTQTATGLAPGTYIVNVTDNAGCTASSSVTITEPTDLTAQITDTSMVACYGMHTGMAEVTAAGGTPPYQYAWASSSSTTNQVSDYPAGNYSVTVTDDNGCTEVVPFIITQNPQLNLVMSPTDEGCENSCNGELATTVTGGVGPYSYVWAPGGLTTPSILDLCTGNYAVTVTDAENCTVSDNATIATNTIITVNANASPVTGIAPASIQFNYTGAGGTMFAWDFGDGGISTDENPVHIYAAAGTYTITLTVNSGNPDFCEAVYTLEIIIYPPSTVEIPNVMTPNEDGYNDVFKVKSDGLDSESMVIYNRWGKKVWEWSEVHGEWKGEMNSGTNASAGVYYYILDAAGYDGVEYHVNGTVTLLR